MFVIMKNEKENAVKKGNKDISNILHNRKDSLTEVTLLEFKLYFSSVQASRILIILHYFILLKPEAQRTQSILNKDICLVRQLKYI